mmetsp:Transcript_31612/g.72143  ORF Transcript_31612/g.72143 Transcript_31612/m.72143 type:complete len:605 (-) Transcript_31612:74-1888(-)
MALLGSAPLQLAQLLLLLRCKLAVTTTVEDVHLVTSGNERCSCATNVSQLPNASSTYNMPIGYGLGCYPHDRAQSPFPDCTHAPLADFCLRSWCYLAADTACALSVEVGWSTMYPGLRYSYETCGSFNSYETFALENRLLGSNLRVMYLQNSGGWKGSTCPDDSQCSGPVVEYMHKIILEYGVNVEVLHTFRSGEDFYVNFTDPPFPQEVMLGIESAFGSDYAAGKVSGFNACVVASALGYVDLCIATFLINTKRQQLGNMIPLISEPVYLVTRASHDNPTVWDKAQGAFKPFSMNLWLCILVCIMLLSMVMVLEEHGKEDFKAVKWWGVPLMGCFKGLESFNGAASTFHPHTAGGRVVQIGLGFFILLVVAGYTANLASLLVVQKSISTSINSMEDVIQQGVKVCADSNLVTKMKSTFPEASHLVHKAPNRSASLMLMGTDCDAAAIRLQDLQAQYSVANFCDIIRVGDPLMFLQDGVATSTAIFRSLRLVVSDPSNGGIEQELEQSVPEDACGDSEEGTDEESESLTVDSMYGAFLVAIAAMIIGVLLELPRLLRHKRHKGVLESKPRAEENSPSALAEPSALIPAGLQKHDQPTQPQMSEV